MAKKQNDIFDFDEVKEELVEVTEVKHLNLVSNIMERDAQKIINPCDMGGSLKIMAFDIEVPEDYADGSTFSLFVIPPGEVRILGHLSAFEFDLSCEYVDLGWVKYKTRGLNIIESNSIGFGRVEDVKSFYQPFNHIKLGTIKIDSLSGVPFVCTVYGDGKKGDFIRGYVIYVRL